MAANTKLPGSDAALRRRQKLTIPGADSAGSTFTGGGSVRAPGAEIGPVPGAAAVQSTAPRAAAVQSAAPAAAPQDYAPSGAVTQSLEAGKIYHFTGALTALTLTLGLAIIGQPADASAPLNETVSFRVEAVGEGLSYQWQSCSGGRWVNNSFATSQTDTLSVKVTDARNGAQYRCVVTDAAGNTVASVPATLTVGESSGGAAASVPVAPRYHFDFISGATAPTVTMPASVTMPDGFTVEADRRYEVDLLGGWGVAQSWAVSA